MATGQAEEQARPGSLRAQLGDPCFFLVDFDFDDRVAVFARAQVQWFAEKLRLSAYDLPLESLVSLPVEAVLAALPEPPRATINYLFHLPFCGSSFLTRHLEHDAVLLLRDPAALDAVFRTQPGREYPSFIAELRDLSLTCLGRRLGSRSTVIRTAGYYPQMLEPLIASPTFRAGLLLYSSPEHYLIQVLKSAQRRRHVRLVMAGELAFVRARTGELLDTLPDASVAALFWLRYVETALALAEARLRTLDCELLFAEPEQVVARVSDLFAIAADGLPEGRARALRSVHAKTGEAFSVDARAAELERGRVAFRSELDAAAELLDAAGAPALLAQLEAQALP